MFQPSSVPIRIIVTVLAGIFVPVAYTYALDSAEVRHLPTPEKHEAQNSAPQKAARSRFHLATRLNLSPVKPNLIRYGLLDEDDIADVLLVRVRKRSIESLQAIRLDGSLLWKWGNSRRDVLPSPSADAAVQVVNIDSDPWMEVICVLDDTLYIIDGRTGTIQQSKTVGTPYQDAVYLFSSRVGEAIDRIVIKDRYESFRVFDEELNELFGARVNTGHFPIAFDLDKDGENELMVGYQIFNGTGQVIQSFEYLVKNDHPDSHDIADMDGDGNLEMGIAGSTDGAYLLSLPTGKLLFERKLVHAQHAIIGDFQWNHPGKEIIFVDRTGPTESKVLCYTAKGRLLWTSGPYPRGLIASGVDGWFADGKRSLLLLYRTRDGNPILLGPSGKLFHRLSIKPASRGKEKRRGSKKRREKTVFAQHFDLWDDAREEILVFGNQAISIFANTSSPGENLIGGEELPNSRIFNATFYTGVQ